jgi:hypothetical protein
MRLRKPHHTVRAAEAEGTGMSSSQSTREQRGRELAGRLRIVQSPSGTWTVPSDSGQGKYVVDVEARPAPAPITS